MFFAAGEIMKSATLFSSLLILLVLSGCAGNPNPSRQIDDALLASRVTESLKSEGLMMQGNMTVDARNGIVTLRGTVASAEEKARATRLAQAITGVISVVNSMTVR